MKVEYVRRKIREYKDKKQYIIDNDLKIRGVLFHKIMHPVLCMILKIRRKFNGQNFTIINNASKVGEKPVIYAMSHIGNYDFEMVMQAINNFSYVIAGDWDLAYGSLDDYFFRAKGVIYVDNEDEKDRENSLKMCIKALKQGVSMIWCPEGTWNLSTKKPMLDLYPGIIKAAKEADVDIVPIAIEQIDKEFYINIGKNIESKDLESDIDEARKSLRDIMASLKWKIWERFPLESRLQIPNDYFDSFVQARMRECSYIPRINLKNREYKDKKKVDYQEAFGFLYPEKTKKKSFYRLTREEEENLDEEAYREYYNCLRELYDKSFLNNLSHETRLRLHPFLLTIIKVRNRLQGYHLQVVDDEREKTARPIIYAITHICKKDIEMVSEAIKSHYYLLEGDFESIHDTLDGIFLGLNGVLYFNEKDKIDRHKVKERMEEVLKNGGYIMYFPEGTWNLTAELLLNPLYPGIIEVAKNANAIIVPIAIEQYDKKFVCKIGKNFDVNNILDNEVARKQLRDVMGELKYDVLASVLPVARKDIPANYYEKFLDDRIGEWPNLTLEDFTKAVYKEKDVTTEEEAFALVRKLHKHNK